VSGLPGREQAVSWNLAGGHLPPVLGQRDPYPRADVSGRCCWEACEQKSVRTSDVLMIGLTRRLRNLSDRRTRSNEGSRLGIVGQVLDFALADGTRLERHEPPHGAEG